MNLGESRVKIIQKFYDLKAICHENFIFCKSEENRKTDQSLRFSSRPKIWKIKQIFFGFLSTLFLNLNFFYLGHENASLDRKFSVTI